MKLKTNKPDDNRSNVIHTMNAVQNINTQLQVKENLAKLCNREIAAANRQGDRETVCFWAHKKDSALYDIHLLKRQLKQIQQMQTA